MFWQDCNTPLHDASRNGEVDAIKLLLEKGANVNDVNIVSCISVTKLRIMYKLNELWVIGTYTLIFSTVAISA